MRVWTACCAFTAMVGLWSGAVAAPVTATYKGRVTSGFDGSGVFGNPGTSLAGDLITVVYKVDDKIPAHYEYDPPFSSEAFGGTTHGYGFAPVSAVVSIKGFRDVISGSNDGRVQQSTLSGGGALVRHYSDDFHQTGIGPRYNIVDTSVFSQIDSIVANSDWHTPLSYTLTPRDGSRGDLEDYLQIANTDQFPIFATATFSIASVTIGAPEPEPWAFIILGSGLLGAARRRARSAALLSLAA